MASNSALEVLCASILLLTDCLLNHSDSLAYRSGVTTGVTAPIPGYRGFYGGLGTSFSTGAAHKLEKGAVLKEETAVHMYVHHVGLPSVSTQIAALRKLLLAPHDGWEDSWYSRVVEVKDITLLCCSNLYWCALGGDTSRCGCSLS
jgi:hypothetical protein